MRPQNEKDGILHLGADVLRAGAWLAASQATTKLLDGAAGTMGQHLLRSLL
jgi:hypothetical protein